MSIRSYFKSVSSFPTSEENGCGAVATRDANRSVQQALDEPRSQQPPSKQLKHTSSSDDQRAKLGSMLQKMETLLLKENSVLSFQHSE